MLIFDAHLDLSMNALEWNRDLTLPVAEIRQREQGMTDKRDRGQNTVALPDMRRGGVGLCVATMIARSAPGKSLLPQLPGFSSPQIAWAMTQGQLAWYRALEEAGELVQITDAAGLDRQVALWEGTQSPSHLALGEPTLAPGERHLAPGEYTGGRPANSASPDRPTDAAERRLPIGYVLSLEGADSILTPRHLERAYAQGLRAVGPVHYGPGRYGQGTHSVGGLTPIGRELLAEMRRLGVILDATHLSDEGFWEALQCFDGPVWASHNNCRALVPDQRQFSDEQIQALVERGAVIGGALDAWMMVPGWQRGKTTPQQAGVRLEHLIDHIHHVCQIAGNANHSAIGTDLDGGYGKEQTPADLDTIADLARLPAMFAARGFDGQDIAKIMHGNWIRFLKRAWE